MVCVKCGQELNDGAKFCTKCGEKYVSSEKYEKYAITSLILGIVGLLSLGLLLIPGIIGLIFGIKSINGIHRRMAITGIILNALQFLFLLLFIVVIVIII